MSLEVLTVTYAPDLELFRDLHASVLRFTDESVIHRVVVDDPELALFSEFVGPRCVVVSVGSVLPRSFVKVPGRNILVNLRRPWPPVRGWVFQQVVKLAMVGSSRADVVLLMDSDVALTKPIAAGNFQTAGVPKFFRVPGAVHAGMTRHVLWHQAAMDMLGVSGAAAPPLADYVDSFNIWSPALVNSMCERIEAVTRHPWQTSFASHLHVSEFILYGVYVDQVLGGSAPVHAVDRMGCLNYWDEVPLDHETAGSFVDRVRPDDIAVMISAKSGTSLEVRRDILGRLTDLTD